jgi:hypothetical protein
MKAIASTAPTRGSYRVYLVGGATAVLLGWRESTVDADLYAEQDVVFRHIQEIKERLQLNIEFARPEDFVPSLQGSGDRHVFIEAVRNVSFFHYDPYAQTFSKVVRGFAQDLQDAERFISSGMVDPALFRRLVSEVPEKAWARYPAISRQAVMQAVERFLQGGSTSR